MNKRKLHTALCICGIVCSIYVPALVFPMCIITFPLSGGLTVLYFACIGGSIWLTPLKYAVPLCLLKGSTGGYYVDHIVICIVASLCLPFKVLMFIFCIYCALQHVTRNIPHHKHVSIF